MGTNSAEYGDSGEAASGSFRNVFVTPCTTRATLSSQSRQYASCINAESREQCNATFFGDSLTPDLRAVAIEK